MGKKKLVLHGNKVFDMVPLFSSHTAFRVRLNVLWARFNAIDLTLILSHSIYFHSLKVTEVPSVSINSLTDYHSYCSVTVN